ncbi:MAG: tetratricopeptide (TPR) repeat protein [Burkholderiaceae bacterium]
MTEPIDTQSRRFLRIGLFVGANLLLRRLRWVMPALIVWALSAHAARAVDRCAPPVARLVSLQGTVELWHSEPTGWQAASTGTVLCPQDKVRVGLSSRAALLLPNETTLRLNQKTTVMISALDDRPRPLIDLLLGAIHVITRTPQPFSIKTPFVNANIEGTEFAIGVDTAAATFAVIEGRVALDNPYGRIVLADGDAGIAATGRAPEKTVMIRPAGAVQWALYYPAVLARRTGLQSTDSTYQSVDSDGRIARAGQLLNVGRHEEAARELDQVLSVDSSDSRANALKAIIALVHNDTQTALDFAHRATANHAPSAASWLAQSYVEQARFRIDDARSSARIATRVAPEDAVAWARVAELEMANGNLDAARQAASTAVGLDPQVAKTHTVLGFAQLTQMQTGPAMVAFERAIALDQADPLPRLGLGLAKIRKGELGAGRADIAIAASLDPLDALIRSYLGKAYFEEKRDALAATQLQLAKTLDPNDPTPWFYDAIRKQSENRPVEALADLEQSIALNQNRAVYRSQLLLDSDRASRLAGIAKIYDDLAFARFAVSEATQSLAADASNYSGHHFLADAYARLERHEIASVSERLQAQLLQPLNINPVQPKLAFSNINTPGLNGPVVSAFNEFNPLFERNATQLAVSAVAGTQATVAGEAVLSGVEDRFSWSVGGFHFDTQGFRVNNAIRHAVGDAFVQFALSPRLNLQAELSHRVTEHGDISLDNVPGRYAEFYRRSLDQSIARLGLHWAGSNYADTLVSLIHTRADERQYFDIDGLASLNSRDQGDQFEVQQQLRLPRVNLVAGAGTYRFDVHEKLFGAPNQFTRSRWNAYGYGRVRLSEDVIATVGASLDDYAEADFRQQKWNPKLGLQWQINPRLMLRAASFQTVKPALYVQQTIEPTEVSGFNQFFDEGNGSRARRDAMALDLKAAPGLKLQLEASRRRLALPVLADNMLTDTETQREKALRLSLGWQIAPRWTVAGEALAERFDRQSALLFGPSLIRTNTASVDVRYFQPNGVFARISATAVRQRVDATNGELVESNTDCFALLNAAFGIRLPARMGTITLEGRNLLDRKFRYQDANFRTPAQQSPPFIPARSVFIELTAAF